MQDERCCPAAPFGSEKGEAIPIGPALIEHERALNEDFAKRAVTQTSLEIGTILAQARYPR